MDDQAPSQMQPPTPPRLANRFSVGPSRNLRPIIIGAVAVVVVAALLLPPIALFDRIFSSCGELEINAETAAVAPEQGGVTIARASEGQSYRLTVLGQSAADFAASSDEALVAARNALPINLMVASSVYQIQPCGDEAQSATISIDVAQSSNSNLDLYGWDAESATWTWLGGQHTSETTLAAGVSDLPDLVAAMGATSVAPAIGVEIGSGESLSAEVGAAATELYPVGPVITVDGPLSGDLSNLPSANSAQAVYPVVRNYLQEGLANPDLVRGVLAVQAARDVHVDALVSLAVDSDYAGVTLDYQGLLAEDAAAFTAFISDAADALHAQGKRLNVVLPAPVRGDNGAADTGGYDWFSIGRLADTVLSPLNDSFLMDWAVSQVNRYKLQTIVALDHVESSNGLAKSINFVQAIEPLGLAFSEVLSVTAESPVTLTLQSDYAINNFTFDAAARAYRYDYADEDGVQRSVTIGTAAGLADRLALVMPYDVRGVVVRGAAGDIAPHVDEVLSAYRQQAIAEVSPELMVRWQIDSGGVEFNSIEKALNESWYVWQTPAQAADFQVSASIAGIERGALDLKVSVASATEEEVASVTAGAGGGVTDSASGDDATAGDCYNAVYVADVSVPDGTHFDKDEEFTKTWKVRNTGSCDWDADTEIAFVSGSQLNAESTVEVGALDAGDDIDIEVPMKASNDGSFTGVWRMRNSDGFFGEQLTVVIQSGEVTVAAAPASPAPAPAGPIGNIGGFEVGSHIDGYRGVESMKFAGLKWVKVQVGSGGDMAGLINDAHAQGFKILLGVKGDLSLVMDPGYQADYARSVASMAAAGADAIEVWNEPNIDREWPAGQVSGANYTQLLRAAYPAIKAANPGTLVISGAPAPTGFWGAAGCAASGCNDDAFIAQMAAAGAANYMDCIGAHHNAGATAPSASSGHPAGSHYSWYFLPTLNLYYNAFGGARKVCFTELGYLSDDGYPSLESTAPNFAWASNVSVDQQAAWLAEAAAMSANSGKVRLMIVWNFNFTRYDSDPMAGYAMLRPDGGCPACNALNRILGAR